MGAHVPAMASRSAFDVKRRTRAPGKYAPRRAAPGLLCLVVRMRVRVVVAHRSPFFAFSAPERGLVIGGHVIAGLAYPIVPRM